MGKHSVSERNLTVAVNSCYSHWFYYFASEVTPAEISYNVCHVFNSRLECQNFLTLFSTLHFDTYTADAQKK
jgi:hypothetical protein